MKLLHNNSISLLLSYYLITFFSAPIMGQQAGSNQLQGKYGERDMDGHSFNMSRSLNKANSNLLLGGLFPLHTPNRTINELGFMRAEAFRCAIRAANDKNILAGRKIFFNVQDTADVESRTFYACADLADQSRLAVVGASSSSSTEMAVRFFSNFKTATVSYAATSPDLSNLTLNSYDENPSSAGDGGSSSKIFFRTVPNDNYQIAAMLSMAQEMGWTTISGVFGTDLYGQSSKQRFLDQSKGKNILTNCVVSVSLTDLNTGNQLLKRFAKCLIAQKINVVILFASTEISWRTYALLKAEPKLKGIVFFSSDSWTHLFSPSTIQSITGLETSKLGDIIGFSQSMGKDYEAEVFDCVQKFSPTGYYATMRFWEYKFRCVTKPDPEFLPPDKLVNEQASYDMLPPCPASISDRPADGKCQCTMKEVLDWKPDAKLSYVYDSTMVIVEAVRVILNECSSLPPALNYICQSDVVFPEHIGAVLSTLQYQGVTGPISFNGHDRVESSMDVIQYDKQGNSIIRYNFNTKLSKLTSTSAMDWTFFPSSVKPQSEFTPVENSALDFFSLIINILALLGLCCSLYLAITFHQKRNTKVIKKASPMFTQLMLGGISLTYISIIIWSLKPTTWTCTFSVVLPVIGFTLIMSNLLAKFYRIWKIFNNVKMSTLVITDTDLLRFSLAILAVNFSLVAGYLLADGLPDPQFDFFSKSSVDDSIFGSQRMAYLRCPLLKENGANSLAQLIQHILLFVLLGFNALMVTGGCVLAFLTRKVDSAYKESRFIAMVMYNILVVMLVIGPVYGVMESNGDSPLKLYYLRGLAFFFMNTITMASLFIPKLIKLRKQQNNYVEHKTH